MGLRLTDDGLQIIVPASKLHPEEARCLADELRELARKALRNRARKDKTP